MTEGSGIPAARLRSQLRRVFDPQTIAVVGADESNPYATAPLGTLNSEARVYFVSSRSTSFFGHDTFPSLTALETEVDAVFSMMSAERTAALAEEAAGLGVGGMIIVAGGFAEQGNDGGNLQNRLRAAAVRGEMPIIGPNGVGYINVPKKLDLTMLADFGRRAGGVSLVSQSGAVLEAFAASAYRAGGVGLNMMISAGNEPVTDMADYLDYLVDDPETRVICLVIEKIRRPATFFAAAARARATNKPIVVVKLARTERTQRMAGSHTGTLTGDAWVYEQAFKQAGIIMADEIDEMVDRVQFLEQLPNEKWTPVNGLFVFTATGGFAAMAADLAEKEGVDIPEVEDLVPWIGGVLPGTVVANPLDATGFVSSRPELFLNLMDTYTVRPEFDAFVFFHQVAEWDTKPAILSRAWAEYVRQRQPAAVISPMAGHGGRWLDKIRDDTGVGVGNGIRGSLRGFNTMARFMRSRADSAVRSALEVAEVSRPGSEPVQSEIGPILSFHDTMQMLKGAGVPIARYQVIAGDGAVDVSFNGPYVVKLADVAHRTEHDAVRVGVERDRLTDVVEELRELAREDKLPETVAIQELITGQGEAFIGIRGSSELGPVVVFGLGGVFVEVLKRVSGRLAPMTKDDAKELIAEFDDTGVLDGVRGKDAWNRDQLHEILVSAGQLAAAGRSWIETVDINPLIQGPNGLVAVDGLVVLRAE
jgi:acyl-CoA synthetase (NDP forming)